MHILLLISFMQQPLQKKHPIRLDFAVSMTIFIFMYDINSKLRENSIKKSVLSDEDIMHRI